MRDAYDLIEAMESYVMHYRNDPTTCEAARDDADSLLADVAKFLHRNAHLSSDNMPSR